MARKKQKEEPTSWVVRARCLVEKEFIIEGTRHQAESLSGKVDDEIELDMINFDVISVKPNR